MKTATEFTFKKYHPSCNGCYFQHKNLVTCTQIENQNLLFDLWKKFGFCFKKPIIYILKDEKSN